MNEVKDVKIDEDANFYQKVGVVSKTDHKSTNEISNEDIDSDNSVKTGNEDLNYITISSDGNEANYHKGGLIIGVLVIFLLGVLVGALVF